MWTKQIKNDFVDRGNNRVRKDDVAESDPVPFKFSWANKNLPEKLRPTNKDFKVELQKHKPILMDRLEILAYDQIRDNGEPGDFDKKVDGLHVKVTEYVLELINKQ